MKLHPGRRSELSEIFEGESQASGSMCRMVKGGKQTN